MESGLISVDRWKKGSQAYFLTHMHSDHTRGLSGGWSQGPLYCSRTTASLFPSRFPGFDLSLLRVVPLSSWTSISLRSPSSSSAVSLHFMAIDAHHCPGSLMFLFRGDFGCFLYTGDFRWDADAADESKNTLVAAINEFPVDILYLDNTYCNPIYSFPSRLVAADLVADIITSHPSHDIIIAVDSLGKEDLLVHVSRILNIKIWVWPERLRTMHLLGYQDIFTTDTTCTRVRAVPRYSFSIQTLEGLNTMCPTIGIMPSGLPWVKRPFKGDDDDKLSGSLLTATYETIPAAVHRFHDYMYSVHYSDHSCYEEIGEFIELVKPKSMKGIVVSSSCYVDPLYYFGRICGTSQPPQVLLMRPDTAEQFRAVRIKSYSGLTDDAAELCLSQIPRYNFRIISQVCRRWRSFLSSEHFTAVRKLTGTVEEFLCVLMESECGRDVYWEVFDGSGNKLGQIPPVPGPLKRGFGVAVLDGGKIVFIGGYMEVEGSGINSTTVSASADVYEFDPAVNSWRKLAGMNIPRYNFAFAQVNGLLYVIRGYSTDAYSLSNAEVYNPETNQWSLMDCPNRPVWRGFAFSFTSKLYAVGNGSRCIDIYDPKTQTWEELKSEQSVSVYSYTVVRNKVYFMDRNMPGCLGVFDPDENSWSSVSVPPREGGFWVRLGVWNNKVLLFSRVCGHETLMYDLDKDKGSKWSVCDQIKPSASQLASVLINY